MQFTLPDTPLPAALRIAFSGGLDSTVLLHALAPWAAQRGIALRATHVNHGLQPDATRWAEHCQSLGTHWGVPTEVLAVAVSCHDEGMEAAARQARYAALTATALPEEWLVVAHHRDDQAETVLLNWLRGASEGGISGMRLLTTDARGIVWRPLLHTARADISYYATKHGLTWIDDPSNTDVRLRRNALRHEVLPLLRRHWPGCDVALAIGAQHLADTEALIEPQVAALLAAASRPQPTQLDLAALAQAPPALGRRALRRWLLAQGARGLRAVHLSHVLDHWPRLRSDASAQQDFGPVRIRAWRGVLHAVTRQRWTPEPRDWDGRQPLDLPEGRRLSLVGARCFEQALQVRTRQPGDTLSPAGRPRQALKKLLPALGIPPWERDAVPLLCSAEGTVLAVADLAYDARFEAWLQLHGARLRWSTPHE